MRFALPALMVATFVGASAVQPQAPGMPQAHEVLRTVGGFSGAQLAAIERGEAVAKVLSTERREIAIVGAVRIRGSRERLLDRYRDVSNLRKSNIVLEAGTFSRPPRTEDLAGLTVEPYDLDAPKNCAPGDCAVRLPADVMLRMRNSVKWTAPNARQQSAAAWRQTLAEVARGYAASGDAALPEYANKKEPLSVRSEFDALYNQFGFLAGIAPELLRYIREYPHALLEHVEDGLYWSKNDLGIRPVMGITHQIIHAAPGGPAFIAQKRIYAAHYVDGGLGVTMLTNDNSGGFYMVTIDRIRTRSLASFTRAIVRSIVQDKSRDGLEKMLRSSKRSLESLSPSP